MMQVVPKWKVTVTFSDRNLVFWVSDSSISNVMRKIADMQFTENGLEQPVQITIGAAS